MANEPTATDVYIARLSNESMNYMQERDRWRRVAEWSFVMLGVSMSVNCVILLSWWLGGR